MYLKDHHSSPFTNDEPTTIFSKWTRGFARSVIKVGGQASGAFEACESERVNAGLCSASEHYVGIAEGYEA